MIALIGVHLGVDCRRAIRPSGLNLTNDGRDGGGVSIRISLKAAAKARALTKLR